MKTIPILIASFLLFASLTASAQQDPFVFDHIKQLTQQSREAQADRRKSRRFARQAFQVATETMESGDTFTKAQNKTLADAYLIFAESQYERENYLDAKEIMQTVLELASQSEYEEATDAATKTISSVDSLIAAGEIKDNFFTRTMSDINVSSAINNSSANVSISVAIKTGKVMENRGDTLGAIEQYQKAAGLMRSIGEFEKAAELENKISTLQQLQALNEQVSKSDLPKIKPIDTILFTIDSAYLQPVDPKVIEQERTQLSDLQSRAKQLEETRDYEQALTYYKEYVALQQQIERDSLSRSVQEAVASAELDRLRQESVLADLNISAIQREKEIQVRVKNTLIFIASVIGVMSVGLLFLYFTKRRKHQQLTLAYVQLDQAKEELEGAERRISKLLQQQVSPEIASALIEEQPDRKKQYVAIMFLDIRGFTPIAEKMEPQELIVYQNKVFGFMIDIISTHGGNINQFMGDGFMATFGAPVSHGNDSRNAFLAGKAILEGIEALNNKEPDLPRTNVGIGIHCGEVVTGNVGTESRKQFSVTGNTVIIAARVEQLNKTYGSNMIITDEVHQKLDPGDLAAEDYKREETHVKGRSEPVEILIFAHDHETVS